MWPFRRRADDTPASSPVHRAGPGDWRHLAPIATVQTAPLTTIDGRFEDHLATRQSPQFLRQLGHHLVSDGPSGRVAAAVVPGTRRDFAPVPAQRQVASLSTTTPAAPSPHGNDAGPHDPHDGGVDVVDPPAEPAEAPTVGARLNGSSAPAARPEPTAVATARPVERRSLVSAPEPPSLPSTIVPTVSRLADADGPPPAADPSSPTDTGEIDEVTVGRSLVPTTADVDVPVVTPTEVALVGGEPAPMPSATTADRSAEPTSISYTGPRSEPAVAPALRSSSAGPEPVTPAGPSPTAATAKPIQRSAASTTTPPPGPAVSPHGSTAGAAPGPADPVIDVAPVAPDPGTEAPIVTAPLDRPMRTVIGLPIVKVPGPAGSAAASGGPTVARELLAPSPSPSSSPAGADDDRAAPPAGAPVPRLDGVLDAAGDEGAAVAPDVRPTLGREDGTPAFEPDVATTGVPAPSLASGPISTPISTPAPAPAPAETAAAVDPVDGGSTETRPTLTSEWLPTVARQVLDPSVPSPSATPLGPALAPTVQRADATAFDEPWADGAASAPWSDGAGSGPTTFETTIATLGGQPGLSAPARPARSTGAQRVAIGPPISRAALQRSPLTLPSTGATSPTSAPNLSFDAAPGERNSSVGGADADEPITEWPIVQFELAGPSAAPPGGASSPDTTVMRAEATSGPAATAGASGPAGRSDAEVDELLRAMYPQLRRQLCRDLLLDRERAGYGTDIRF